MLLLVLSKHVHTHNNFGLPMYTYTDIYGIVLQLALTGHKQVIR